MSWTYDSGGKHQDQKKYAENYERIFGCKECKMIGGQHKPYCERGSSNESVLEAEEECGGSQSPEEP